MQTLYEFLDVDSKNPNFVVTHRITCFSHIFNFQVIDSFCFLLLNEPHMVNVPAHTIF